MRKATCPNEDDAAGFGLPGPTPRLFDFSNEEREKVAAWLRRQMVIFDFRMEEIGPPSEIISVRKWQSQQRKYWKHCRKFCKSLLDSLDKRDRLDWGERD